MAFTGNEGSPINEITAAAWTKNYREANPEQQLAKFFGREILLTLLEQEGCKGIRFYYGLDEEVPQLLAVGADNEENDQLGSTFIVADDACPSPPRGGQANILNS